jgi:uncharacterized protein YggE
VADARAKAQALAVSAGVTVGRITAIVEGNGAPSPMAAADAGRVSLAPIEPGTQDIQAVVTVTFSLG